MSNQVIDANARRRNPVGDPGPSGLGRTKRATKPPVRFGATSSTNPDSSQSACVDT